MVFEEYAGVDPATGDALYYVNTKDADNNVIDHTTLTNDASKANVADVGKHAMPKLTSNFTNNFYYKNFDLGITFSGAWGGYSYDYMGANYTETDGAYMTRNWPKYFMNVGKKQVTKQTFHVFLLQILQKR